MKLFARSMTVFLIAFSPFTFAETTTPPALIQAEQTIMNFHTFGTNLFRGARPTAENLKTLKSLGVKTIIDLQGGDIKDETFGFIASWVEPGEDPSWIRFEKKTAQSLGMNFVHLPLSSLSPIDDYKTGKSIGQILKVINNPDNQPVYVHCERGKDRTGLVVALYRVYFQNWSKEAAHNEMLELGHSTFWTSDMDEFFNAATADMN